ncbi:MAG: HAD hydrolase family protein [Elusimicrobiota bacterium]|nr:HAD hydrolase family protein [Elusimicrobiota bacterium]MDH5662003.1 HAD hydrolase family protein [Elusimicrobiota bacterium]
MEKKIKTKAQNIKMLGMDVDGVLTPGDIVIMESGEEIKSWNVKDRMGFNLARRSGNLKFAWISGRGCKQVEKTAEDLKIEAVRLKRMDKNEALQEILQEFELKKENFAYIGDDLVDIPVLKRAGLSFCPKDAPQEVKQVVDYVTKTEGGRGVLREVVEVILKLQGKWEETTGEYCNK